jgi:hypothetical protein
MVFPCSFHNIVQASKQTLMDMPGSAKHPVAHKQTWQAIETCQVLLRRISPD